MIGKSGARQEIENHLSEIGYFVQGFKETKYDDIPNWKGKVMDHINWVLHIIDTYDDSKVEPEESPYRDGLKFTYIRRGYGDIGAQVFFDRHDIMLKIEFWSSINGNTTSLSYETDGYVTHLFFRKDGESIYKEIEND